MKIGTGDRKNKRSMGAVILHVYSDQNKGDQGIVFSSIGLLEEWGYNVHLLSMYHADDVRYKKDHQEFIKKGYHPFPAIFPEPHIRKPGDPEVGSIIGKISTFFFYLMKSQLILLLFKCHPSGPKLLFRGVERESWEMIRKCRLAVVKGGSFFFGLRNIRTNFYYLRILYHLYYIKKLGLKVVIFPQSMGPWETWFARWISRRIINKMDAVIVREKLSVSVLKKNRINRIPVYVLPDVALIAGKPSPISDFPSLDEGNNFVVNARSFDFSDPYQKRRYIQSIIDVINFLKDQGGNVFLFPQATGPTSDEDDLIVLRMIYDMLTDRNNVFLIDKNYNYGELMFLYGKMDLLVTTRLHAAIFAMSQVVPAVAISYHGTKTKGLYQMMGLDDLVLEINDVTSEQLIGVVEDALDKNRFYKEKIKKFLKKTRYEYDNVLSKIFSVPQEKESQK